LNGQQVPLESLCKIPGESFQYIYGLPVREWRHEVVLEAVEDSKLTIPQCVRAKGAAPTERCEGATEYVNIILALLSKQKAFDPDFVDIQQLNLELERTFLVREEVEDEQSDAEGEGEEGEGATGEGEEDVAAEQK